MEGTIFAILHLLTPVFIIGFVVLMIILIIRKNKYWPFAAIGAIATIALLFIRLPGPSSDELFNNDKIMLERNAKIFEEQAMNVDGGISVCLDHTTNADMFTEEQIQKIRNDINKLNIDCIILDNSHEVVDFRDIGWSDVGYYYLINPENFMNTEFKDEDNEYRINDRWIEYF